MEIPHQKPIETLGPYRNALEDGNPEVASPCAEKRSHKPPRVIKGNHSHTDICIYIYAYIYIHIIYIYIHIDIYLYIYIDIDYICVGPYNSNTVVFTVITAGWDCNIIIKIIFVGNVNIPMYCHYARY